MELTNSILEDVREAVGLTKDTADFDTELLMHINSTIVELYQIGVVLPLTVFDTSQKWIDLQDPSKVEGNRHFQMVPLLILLNTKLIFDPPPPSAVEVYSSNTNKLLWRLKVAYEEPQTLLTMRGDLSD